MRRRYAVRRRCVVRKRRAVRKGCAVRKSKNQHRKHRYSESLYTNNAENRGHSMGRINRATETLEHT